MLRIDASCVVRDDGVVQPGTVLVAGDRIVAVDEPARVGEAPVDEVHRADLVVPGHVDLQVNGAAGYDFRDAPASGVREALRWLARHGTTCVLPTIVSAPLDRYRAAIGSIARTQGDDAGAHVAGVHLEGPFLSGRRAGAHELANLRPPDARWTRDLLASSPVAVRIWTLAPELPGALALIEELTEHDVVVSIGHSDARFGEVEDAVRAGASMVTHLFNAQSPLHHREPGVVGAALAMPQLRVGLILDGHHVDPIVAELALKLLGERAFVVSDAVAAAGLPHPGEEPQRALVLPTGVIAGSRQSLHDMFVRAAARWGIEEAVRLTSRNPAVAISEPERGVLRPGAVADLLVLDGGLAVEEVYLRGRPLLGDRRAPAPGGP